MPVRYLMNAVLVALLFVGLSFLTQNVLSTYQNKVLLTVGINIILAVSLNVATGYLGQLPLGHAGFMAVGAYACALFTKSSGLPKGVAFVIGLVLAWVIAGLFGVLIGIPALRLTGDYLAILTLGFGEIIRITLNNIDDVLGFKLFYGAKGLKNIPKYSNFTNVFLCVVITCFLIHAMMKSRHGRAVLAIRDNEIAAESCGIQTTYYKVMAFAFSAAFAGLAGGLYACYIGVLNPSTFGFMKSIEILVMVVLGGMGSMLGSILSATVLTILPEATRSFDSYRMVVYSLGLAFCYRSINLKSLWKIIVDSAKMSGMVVFLVGVSNILGWVMAFLQIPDAVAAALLSLTSNKYIILLIMNVILLVSGTFMDVTPAILIFTPLFLPICQSFGMSTIQFGLILVYNLCIGNITPPVGNALFVGIKVGRTTLAKVMPYMLMYYAAIILGLLLVTYIPAVSMVLPQVTGLV